MSYLPLRLLPNHSLSLRTVKDRKRMLGKALVFTMVSTMLAPLYGQTSSAAPSSGGPGILKDYDQAIDQVAERAMQSVVEIEVTGFGVPEHDRDSGDQNPALE